MCVGVCVWERERERERERNTKIALAYNIVLPNQSLLKQSQKCEMRAIQFATAVWPDLTKFRHFGYICKVYSNFWGFIQYLAKLRAHFCKVFYAFGQIIMVANDQYGKISFLSGHTFAMFL